MSLKVIAPNMKNKFIYRYYFVLLLVLALSNRMSVSSNAIFRIGYLAALFLPLLKNIELFPAILLGSLCMVKNTFAPIFVPTELYYYTLLALAFLVLYMAGGYKAVKIKPLFLVILLYMAVSDLLFQGHIANVTSILFVLILVYVCAEADIGSVTSSLSLIFLFFSLVLCYWMFIIPEDFLKEYNSADDMTQMGWVDPNYFGCSIGTGMILSIMKLFQKGRTKMYSIIIILTIILSFITLLGIASRGIMLSVSVSAVLMMAFSKVSRRRKFLTIVALVLFVVVLYTNRYFDFILARYQLDDGTGSGRTAIWIEKLGVFFKEGSVLNWLFGFGQDAEIRLGMRMASHNDFVSVLIYYGFIGLTLLFCVIAYPVKICSKKAKPQVVALLAYLIMCSMSIDPIVHGHVAYLCFFFYIILFAQRSRQVDVLEMKQI